MDGYSLGYETNPLPDNGKSVNVVAPTTSPAQAGTDWLTAARIGNPDGQPLDLAAQDARDAKLWETLGSSYQAAVYDATSQGNDIALSDAIDQRNQAVFQATGEQLENPMKGGYVAPALAAVQPQRTHPAPYAGPTAALMAGAAGDDNAQALQAKQLDLYNAALADVARKHPDKPSLAAPILQARNDLVTAAEARAEKAVAADGVRGRVFGVVGGMGSMARDPIQMLANGIPLAGQLRATSMLGRVVESGLRHAATAAGVQAVLEPKLQQQRAERGVTHGIMPALGDIGTAAAFGSVFGLVHGLLARHGGASHLEAAAAGDPAAVASLSATIPRETAPVLHAAALDHALDRAVMEHRPSRADPEALGQAVRDAVRFGEGIGPLPGLVLDKGERIEPTLDFQAAVRRSQVPPAAAAEIPAMVADPTQHLALLDALDVAGAATPEEARAVLTDELRVQSHPQAVEAMLGMVPMAPIQQRARQAQTLLGFMRAAGGIVDDGGELAARDLHKIFPGLVNNRTGVPLDRMREMAAEAGYLGPDTARAVAETTVDDLLQAIDRHPVYSIHDEARLATTAERSARRRWLSDTSAARDAIDAFSQEHGIAVDPELRGDAAERMVAHGESVADALRNTHAEEPNVHDDTPQFSAADLDGLPWPGDEVPGDRGAPPAGEREPASPGALRATERDAGPDGGQPRGESGDDGLAALFDVRPSRERADLLNQVPLAERDDGGDAKFYHPDNLAEGETPEEALARHIRECPF